MSEYRCNKCETTHTTENMVSHCASCYAALETTNRLLTKEVEKAREQVQAQHDERTRLQSIINGFCEGLGCSEPANYEAAEAQVQALTRELQDEKDKTAVYRHVPDAKRGECDCYYCLKAMFSALEARERDLVKELEALKKGREFDVSLVGQEIPEDELKVAIDFEDFNSKEAMMCGWRKGDRALYIFARAYKALQSENSLLTRAVEEIRDKWVPALLRDCREADKTDCNAQSIYGVCVRALSPRQPQAEAKPKCWNCGYVRGTDPQEDCMDATCLRCNAPYAKERCAEFGFKPQPPEEGR